MLLPLTLLSPLLGSRFLSHASVDELELAHTLALGAYGASSCLSRHHINFVRLASLCRRLHGLGNRLDLLLLRHFRVLGHEIRLLLCAAKLGDGSLALSRSSLSYLFNLLGTCTLKVALDLRCSFGEDKIKKSAKRGRVKWGNEYYQHVTTNLID
jgi:hypothetical protein